MWMMRTEGRGVRDDGHDRPSADREMLVRSAIGSWRDSLIKATAASQLLDLGPGRTPAVRLVRPSAADVLSRLRSGGTYTFRSLPSSPAWPLLGAEPPTPGDGHSERAPGIPSPTADVLDTDAGPDDLASTLRTLMRRSNQEYLDRGLWVLYLAFGALTWTDQDRARHTSPVLLVPVRLVATGPRQLPALEPAEDDPVVNPALVRKLAQNGITLPPMDEADEVTLAGLLDTVRAAVAGRDGWQVSDGAVLSCFSFASEAIYRDLLEHEDLAAAHPAVRALVAGRPGAAGPGFAFDEIAEREIDTRAPPESIPVILDADAAQRAAIAAALDGRSFVLDGPPGTGKSQTIANMIGALLHAGKTVLFVSEKAAALDVVKDRLAGAGLDAYLLALHSSQAVRTQVAVSLGKALDTVPVAPEPMPHADVDTARRRREQLSAYAEAMNRTRDPLGYSLHDILGVIATLRAVPAVPTTGRAPVADLTVEMFGNIRETAATLAGAWRPAAQGRSFVWRGVTERGPLDDPLYQAASALEALTGITRANQMLAEVTGLTRPSDAGALARLLDHLLTWPPGMPDDWLTAGTLDPVDAAVARLSTAFSEIAATEDKAARDAGVTWSAIPRSSMLPALDDADLARLTPACADAEDLTVEQITGLSMAFSAEADMLERRQGTLAGLARMIGLQAPATFSEAADLLLIAHLAEEPDRPERGWLSAAGSQQAREAGRTLYDAHHALARAEADASPYYTRETLYADVQGLADRFDGEHHRLGKLSAEYRADKKTVAGFTREGVTRETAYQGLALAAAWQRAAQALASAEAACAPLLGRYYAGSTTDFDRLGHALNRAASALQRAHGQDLRRAASYISADARPDPAVTGMAAEVRQDLAAWQATLAAPPASAARPELLDGSIADAIGWLRSHLAPVYAAAAFTHALSEITGQPLTLGQARRLVNLREAADAARQRLAASNAALREVCGDLYAEHQTDLTALRAALDWTRRLRTMITGGAGPLSRAQLKAAESAVPTPRLLEAADAWRQAKDAVMAAFSPDRQADLAAELDDYGATADLIEVMFDDAGGRDEWHTHQAARASLAAHGLDVAIDFCIAEHVEPAQVPQVIERALLQEWAEHHLRTDPALATVRAADRDALVREYQELDRALIAAATGDIIRACNSRRPRSDIGESAIIHREAEKKRKHLPVPVLIERARHVAQAIRPCFMMSPLTVSQYLPADMRFDVVIVDEASQVGPAAAVSCIYRGGALILAGDAKQLPPASFVSGDAPDGGDQLPDEPGDAPDGESVLDLAQGSGAYRSLTLRWHYRSRHEALIAFSNDAFYAGRLVTFPSRHSDGPDVGVELFWVEGTYWRGTSRDNPREAALVAERVIHHYDTRPALSLGVVTLNESQADAIEAAVSRARQYRPDLDRFFTNDRLRGFFVKSAEAVQGDEREVLIFSIGYGPDETGKITTDFGPLNRPGGWRRLNVALTRARYRNEIVSSIRAADIPESVTSEGVRQLRRYLDYATRGLPPPGAGGDAESPFVESVINVIRSWGYGLTPQVGTAGYRIDVGIHYPSHPGVYALGVECDGYQYHSSKAARDRDRLRGQVLRDIGWNLHRIWSAAWYRDREGEERRLQAAIEQAMAASPHALAGGATRPERAARPVVQTEAASDEAMPAVEAAPSEDAVPSPDTMASPDAVPSQDAAASPDAVPSQDAVPSWAVPYATATVPPLPHWIDPADPGSQFTMTDGVRAVVSTEAPVHVSVLHQRLRDAWNIGPSGPTSTHIRDNIDAAIGLADVIREGEFITLADAPRPLVRTPVPACERAIEQVHDRELALALINLVRDAAGISRSELTARVADLYGWTGHEPDITGRMGAIISELRRNGTLAGDQHTAQASVATPAAPAAPARGQGTVGASGTVAGRAASWHADLRDRARP
jgi:hypothetical protein